MERNRAGGGGECARRVNGLNKYCIHCRRTHAQKVDEMVSNGANGDALICTSDKFHMCTLRAVGACVSVYVCTHKTSRNKHASNGNKRYYDLCTDTTTPATNFMGIFQCFTECMPM